MLENDELLSVEALSESQAYSIKQATIKNADDVVVHDCISNGKLDTVNIVKNSDDTVPAQLIAVLYNNGILEKMQTVDIAGTETANSETEYSINLPFEAITSNHYVRIMIWDGISIMKPLVDPYDTRIVATDYIYSNTIQTENQIDEYSFSVPNDGYYSISVPTGTNISGTLYHDTGEETELVQKSNMSATNKISYYLLKNEVYKVNFTSAYLSTYSFTIKADNTNNVLLLNTTATGNIAYKKDKVCYQFTPTETALYFFEANSVVYPTIELSDDNDNSIRFVDNLEYNKNNVLNCELQANQTYSIKVGSQTGLTGNVSIYSKKVKVNISGTSVSITGILGKQSGCRCALAIYDIYGDLVRIAQFNTSSGSSFSYSTTLDTLTQAYQCIINQTSQANPIYFTFGNGSIVKTIEKYTEVSTVGGATVTPTFSATRITANTNMKVDISIKNNDTSKSQEILAFWALTNADGEIEQACGTGSEFKASQTQVLHMEMQMPASVTNSSLRLFVWQGKNIDESSYLPLAKTYVITRSGLSNLSIEDVSTELNGDLETMDNTVSNETFENMDKIDTEDFEIADINNAEVKATSILNKDNLSRAFAEYDYIDMNFQARCNGKNTGGELQKGKNIITIFYKNKTNTAQTFDPLVMWGYYDINGEFQQTYFQWHESITLAAKGASNGRDVMAIEYEVEVPDNTDFAAAYWAINENSDYVCLHPTALRYDGIYKGQATPLFFEEIGDGKFIYCNNREGIKRTDLADSNNPNPKLLMHEKGLPDGKYEMLLFHNNDSSIGVDSYTGETISYGNSFPIYLDVQFYDPFGTAQMVVNSVGYQIPRGESWACIQGYADYKQMVITDLAGNNPVYPNTNLGVPYYHDFSQQSSMWIGNKMPRDYYTSVPVSHCVYMVIEFEIINSQGVEVNVAAVRDNGDFNNRFRDYQAGNDPNVTAPFIKDMQYKGIANTLPFVEAKAIMAFDDDTPNDSNLLMTVFNAHEPGGGIVNWWKTNINPQAENFYANHSDDSGMFHFKYNDPQKLDAYGSSFAGEKDTVWKFDTEHSDTYQFPANRDGNNDPNYVLPRPTIINSNGESSNRYIAQNLANYGVVYRYDYEIYNHSTSQRNINVNLETTANNVIIIRNPDNPNGLYYAMYKGESDPMAKDVVFNASPEGDGNGIGILVDIVLTTGNAGGMSHSININ